MKRQNKMLRFVSIVMMALCVGTAQAKPKVMLRTVNVAVGSSAPDDVEVDKKRWERSGSTNQEGFIDCEGYNVLIDEVGGVTKLWLDENGDGEFTDDEMADLVDGDNYPISLANFTIFLSGGKGGRKTTLTMRGGTIKELYLGSPIYLTTPVFSYPDSYTEEQKYNLKKTYFSETVPTGNISAVITGGTITSKLSFSGGLGTTVPATSGWIDVWMSGVNYQGAYIEYPKNIDLGTGIDELVMTGNTMRQFKTSDNQTYSAYPWQSELDAISQGLVQKSASSSLLWGGGSNLEGRYILNVKTDIECGNLTVKGSQNVLINLDGHTMYGSSTSGGGLWRDIIAQYDVDLTIANGFIKRYNISTASTSSKITLENTSFGSDIWSSNLYNWAGTVVLKGEVYPYGVTLNNYKANRWATATDCTNYQANFGIDDAFDYDIMVRSRVATLHYGRKVQGGSVATFCLPCAVPVSQFNGTVYKLTAFEDKTLKFEEVVDETEANQPYLIVVDGTEEVFLLKDAALSDVFVISGETPEENRVFTNNGGAVSHIGTQTTLRVASDEYDSYFGYNASSGAFVKAKTGTLKPFRTMFKIPNSEVTGGESKVRMQLGTNEADGIIEVDGDLLSGEGSPIYNLSGRRVTHPQRGHIYISNNKKILK